ncbi:MAG TPA: ABC transporter ATP-binding protein [Bdellovibrionota bacterium]|jgi:branched-chain amino acid transport system ATP-binding protein|nr:ABC transporter ATP-binding protein [Bdellovibrionota bacterium]
MTDPSLKPLLDVRGLTIRFGGLVAVNNVSLSIRSGELVGLIGPNGAGKTTCFNMLTGVYEPTEGEILLCDKSLVGVAPHDISSRGISRTFQNIRLFKSMTVLENLYVSMHHEREYSLLDTILRLPRFAVRERALHDKAMEILKVLGLDRHANTAAASLPYGEQRKVEIARALATTPKLLLLDEPAAGMNPAETAMLATYIQQIRKDFDLTILLIEHDMSLVMKICERLYVLDYGQLIAEGSPETVKCNPRVIEAYLGGSVGEAHV